MKKRLIHQSGGIKPKLDAGKVQSMRADQRKDAKAKLIRKMK